MADINLKTLTPDTSLPKDGFIFGADSQATANPSVYSTQTVATTLLGSTSLTGDTLTASAPVLDLTQTWNNGAVTFTGIKYNAAGSSSANSAAASLLMDLQVGGTSQLSVTKAGAINAPVGGYNNATIRFGSFSNTGLYWSSGLFVLDSANVLGAITASGLTLLNDAILSRRGTGNLRFGAADAAAPVAQTLSVQSVVAGTSNTAGADWTLTGSQSTGSGVAGSLVLSTAFANTVGTATVTITIAAPGVVTWTAHGLVTGSPVVFTTTGALPTGITAGTTYFAIPTGVNTFQIATTAALAAAGTAITTSGSQSGTQTGTTSATVQNSLMPVATVGPSGLTGSQATSLLDLKQTWNTSGTPTALKLNVTDTTSNSSSSLMDLQIGGVSKFRVEKSNIYVGTNVALRSGFFIDLSDAAQLGANSSDSANGLFLANTRYLGWSSNGSANGPTDVRLTRRGAANLRFGAADAASPVAQTLSVQSIVGGGGTPNLSAAAYPFKITGAQGTGQGAGGSIIFQTAPAAVSSGNGQNGLTDALTIDSVGSVQIVRALTVATLPGTPLAGMIARVSDANTPVIGMTVAGSGAAYALVNYNGSNWTVIGV
jgi:hypothetical protein